MKSDDLVLGQHLGCGAGLTVRLLLARPQARKAYVVVVKPISRAGERIEVNIDDLWALPGDVHTQVSSLPISELQKEYESLCKGRPLGYDARTKRSSRPKSRPKKEKTPLEKAFEKLSPDQKRKIIEATQGTK